MASPSSHGGVRRLGRLRRRPEFLAVAAARRKWVAPGVILQARRHDAVQRPTPDEPEIRVGFTASKKVGGAVERNRAKRRLRAAVADIFPGQATPGFDYVVIARSETLTRSFEDLKKDLAAGLRKLGGVRVPEGARGDEA